MKTLKELINTLPQIGTVDWIGIRPGRKEAIQSLQSVSASPENGLEGDRYGVKDGARQVTLVQTEHLAVLESLLKPISIKPELLRRNIAVSGINLLSLKNKDMILGSVVLRTTGLCHPCSRMEALLGPGGYNAMRGHGGITARILIPGTIRNGDRVRMLPDLLDDTGKQPESMLSQEQEQQTRSLKPYLPVACSDYDYIELACTKNYIVDIETDSGVIRGKARDTKSENNAEYIEVLDLHRELIKIRLDIIKKINVWSTPTDFDQRVFNS